MLPSKMGQPLSLSLPLLSLSLSEEAQDDTISNTLLFKTFLRMINESVFLFSLNGFSLL